jgi:hypothetical protein
MVVSDVTSEDLGVAWTFGGRSLRTGRAGRTR